MALSSQARRRLIGALTHAVIGKEVADAIDSGGNPQAATVANFGATSNLSAAVVVATVIADSNFTAAVAAEPTKAEIDVGINTLRTAVVAALDVKADNADLETMRTQTEARLDAIEAKINAALTAFKNAGLMA